MPDGRILYEGKSRIDGAPIVAIITGLDGRVSNGKTGSMAQTWILRQDVAPAAATLSGEDESVCGDCVHRTRDGLGTCYVNPAWGPNAIWEYYRAGSYGRITPRDRAWVRDSFHVRFGAYGDPVAVRPWVWRSIMPTDPEDSTGYTHLWRRWRLARPYKDFLMASVESQAEALEAQAKGWRPFLVVPLNRPVPKGYAWCPSDALNPRRKVQCQNCGLCSGARGGVEPVAIYVHGKAAQGFGVRERKANLPGERRASTYDPLVRMQPDLHRALKKHAKAMGRRGIKSWVGEAVRAKMQSEGGSPPSL